MPGHKAQAHVASEAYFARPGLISTCLGLAMRTSTHRFLARNGWSIVPTLRLSLILRKEAIHDRLSQQFLGGRVPRMRRNTQVLEKCDSGLLNGCRLARRRRETNTFAVLLYPVAYRHLSRSGQPVLQLYHARSQSKHSLPSSSYRRRVAAGHTMTRKRFGALDESFSGALRVPFSFVSCRSGILHHIVSAAGSESERRAPLDLPGTPTIDRRTE